MQTYFLGWIEQVITKTKGEVIAIDGKQSRGSYDRNTKKSALDRVRAWASKNRLMLGQVKVEDKSNEITAIPALTLDAMGTQAKIADLIIRNRGDYVLSLKANHPKLLDSVKKCFNHHLQFIQGSEMKPMKSQCSHESKIEASHYRLEKRSY